MLRTTTQKCPSCKYTYMKQQQVENKLVDTNSMATRKYSCRPVPNLHPVYKKVVVKEDILEGDEEFFSLFVTGAFCSFKNSSRAIHHEIELFVCPKCGTVFLPRPTVTVIETEE